MTAQYSVHFSEEDLFHIEGDYCRMYGNITPTPDLRHIVLKSHGVYEISHVSWSLDGHYDVYLQPVVTQAQHGDVIEVHNKDRYYRCHNKDSLYGFKKITILSLMNAIRDLEGKLAALETHVNNLIT